jgi:gliding motility-associated-like protein
MVKTIKLIIVISCLSALMIACNSSDNNNDEQDIFLGCCSEEPVFGSNVDNLDQSLGEIIVYNLFTPNGDGYQDLFGIENIELYDNHTVTIYNSDDEVVFESTDYGGGNEYFPVGMQGENGVEGIPDGTYKYKIVIVNEQTFFKSGTLCLFGDYTALDTQNFSDCNPASNFDPILTGN